MMSVVGEVVSLLMQAHKFWQEQRGLSRVSAQELYNKFIAPSYALLKEIHADYLELYLELQERIQLEERLSAETVQWFSRARSRRQADRSELRLLDLPRLEGRSQRATDINSATQEYLSAVQNYFLPTVESESKFLSWGVRDKSAQRLMRYGTSLSTLTEMRLMLLRRWSTLSEEDQRILLAEEYYETTVPEQATPSEEEELLEKIMAAGLGEAPANDLPRLNALQDEAVMVALNANGKYKTRLPNRLPEDLKDFRWRSVLYSYIQRQRWAIEGAMKEVQESYVRIRILSDRS